MLVRELGIGEEVIASIRKHTVDNPELPHISEKCVMWPAIQNLVRTMWSDATGRGWIPAEHATEGDPYHACHRTNTLMAKTDGVAKMIKAMGSVKFNESLAGVYLAWPNPVEHVTAVTRYNRKTRSNVERQDGDVSYCERRDAILSYCHTSPSCTPGRATVTVADMHVAVLLSPLLRPLPMLHMLRPLPMLRTILPGAHGPSHGEGTELQSSPCSRPAAGRTPMLQP